MKSEFAKRFANLEDDVLLATATVLDSRFKNKGFENDKSFVKIKGTVQQKAASIFIGPSSSATLPEETDATGTHACEDMEVNFPSDSGIAETNKSIWKYLDLSSHCVKNPGEEAIIEFDRYLQEPLLPLNNNPFEW